MPDTVTNLTNDQIEFMRQDLASNMGYTKIIMIAEFIGKYKQQYPTATNDEVYEAVKDFRRSKGWEVA